MGLSCLLIGDDNLLIQCGLLLLEKKYHIRWVISSLKSIHSWCDALNIAWRNSFDELPSDAQVDYLFSIVNNTILSNNQLCRVRIAAINYHDSLLPHYAGLNATTWAMLNNETNHGVSWHLITQGIDEGDILNQRIVPIAADDTVLTLNLKCFEEAIAGFSELITDISTHSLVLQSQSKTQRSYYGLTHLLPDLGFINWTLLTAIDIERFSRALNYGHYNNSVGSLKLYLGTQYLIISEVEIIVGSTQIHEAGMILSIDKAGIVISTLSHPVRVKRYMNADGDELTLDDVIKEYNLVAGTKLHSFTPSAQEKSLYKKGLSRERYWLNQLKKVSEHHIFANRVFAAENEYQKIPSITLSKFDAAFTDSQYYLLTTVLIYLYRLNDYENPTVFLTYPPFNKKNRCAGLFASLVPMTVNFRNNATIHDVLSEINQQLNEVYIHEFYLTDIFARYPSLETVSTDSAITIGFSHQNVPQHSIIHFVIDMDLNELSIYHKIDIQRQGGELQPIITNIHAHLSNILAHILTSPKSFIHEVSFLTSDEHDQIMIWGSGEQRHLPSESITELFEQNVVNFPNNPAIYYNDHMVTYIQLWEEAEKMAVFISNMNLPEQTPIGIYLQRGHQMLISILGILKAGCVYVPLDLKYPMRKIAMIVKEAKLTHFLTTAPYLAQVGAYFATEGLLHIYDVNKLRAHSSLIGKKPLLKNQLKSKRAYIMFTSGTTGIPKGVMVTQKNVINYCYWFTQTTQFNANSIIDFSSSIAFDLSIPCTIAPLLVGGALAICDDQQKINPKLYLRHLQHYKITHTELTPGYLEMLLYYPEEIKKLSTLRYLLLGADVVHTEEVIKWLALCPNSQVINEYGPTETTVSSTSYFVKKMTDLKEAAVPIGTPAFNTACYLLDKYLNLCPLGMKGELHIGGAQVSEGYLDKPQLTAQKFLKTQLPNAHNIMYKTGDLACWSPSGVLQFFGRNDHQVKIQGYRIELPAIESILMKFKAIHQAVVVVRQGKVKYLRAYLVVEDKLLTKDGVPPLTSQNIKEFLSLHLPSYMHPKEFCVVSYIPLKENEKIDFSSLEEQKHTLLTITPEVSAHDLSPTERVCLNIWQSVFHTNAINNEDDFFTFGGDSLIALQIISALKSHYQTPISLSLLFEHPTITSLANKIDELISSKKKSPLIQLNPTSIIKLSSGTYKTPLFLVHPVGGSVFWYQQLAQKLDGKYTVYGIADQSIDGMGPRFTTLAEMAHFYLQEIATVYQGSDYCLGGASFGATVVVEMAKQLLSSNKNVTFLGIFDGWAKYPSDLLDTNTIQLLMNQQPGIEHHTRSYLHELEEYRKKLLLAYSIPILDTQMTLFKAQELWDSFARIDDPHNGWQPYITGAITVHHIPGTHETMFFGANAEQLALNITL